MPALATDMYLAAMPIIAKQWGVPDSRVALSLVLWFAGFSVFLLVCGPLSDKHGRRPVLLAGLTLFASASVAMCTITFFCGMSRPLSNNLILEQVRHDIGSASSFIVFYQFLVGSLCMRLVTMSWAAPIRFFGLVALLLPTLVLAVWPPLLHLLRTPSPVAAQPESANAV